MLTILLPLTKRVHIVLTLFFLRGAAVSVKNTTEESAVSNDILKLPNGVLNPDQPYKVFDMKKFQQNLSRELKRSNPDRLKLESQCISAIAFGADELATDADLEDGDSSANGLIRDRDDPLRCPLWIIVINIVAMEMLRSKLPPGSSMIFHGKNVKKKVQLNCRSCTVLAHVSIC